MASSSLHPSPILQPGIGPAKEQNIAGKTIGSQASTISHPCGASSIGFDNDGLAEKRFAPVKARAANGEARINGMRMREVGVGIMRKEPDVWCIKGMMEKRVRRRVRPIASGMERRSSRPRVGLDGMSLWKEVCVCIRSIGSACVESNRSLQYTRVNPKSSPTLGLRSHEGGVLVQIAGSGLACDQHVHGSEVRLT